MSARTHNRRRATTMVIATLLSGMVVSSATLLKTSSAGFSDATANSANNWTAGTVDVEDNGAGEAMFSTSAPRNDVLLNGGGTITRCIKVRSNSTLLSARGLSVKLYGATTGGTNTLAPYLTVTVDRGEIGAWTAGNLWGTPGSDTSCTGFTADGVNVEGTVAAGGTAGTTAAAGAVFNGTLTAFQALNYASATSNWVPTSNGDLKVYKLTITTANDNAAQGLIANSHFVWEAQTTNGAEGRAALSAPAK